MNEKAASPNLLVFSCDNLAIDNFNVANIEKCQNTMGYINKEANVGQYVTHI